MKLTGALALYTVWRPIPVSDDGAPLKPVAEPPRPTASASDPRQR